MPNFIKIKKVLRFIFVKLVDFAWNDTRLLLNVYMKIGLLKFKHPSKVKELIVAISLIQIIARNVPLKDHSEKKQFLFLLSLSI